MDSVLSVLRAFKFCEEDYVNDRRSTIIILIITRRPVKIYEGEPSAELNFCAQLTIRLFTTKEYGPRPREGKGDREGIPHTHPIP